MSLKTFKSEQSDILNRATGGFNQQLFHRRNNCCSGYNFVRPKKKRKDHEKMAECFSCNKAVTSHHLLTVGGKYKMQSWKRGFKQFPKLRLGKYLVLKIYIFVICKLLERSRCLLWLKPTNHILWFLFPILLSCTLSVWHVPHARNPWCRLASTGESWVWGIIWE